MGTGAVYFLFPRPFESRPVFEREPRLERGPDFADPDPPRVAELGREGLELPGRALGVDLLDPDALGEEGRDVERLARLPALLAGRRAREGPAPVDGRFGSRRRPGDEVDRRYRSDDPGTV
jgi:hypothetical protein